MKSAVKMRRMLFGVCMGACATILIACDRAPVTRADNISFLRELGGTEVAGFERACDVREFKFPQDHIAHPAFRNEWWYVTGNVKSASGEKLGFQFTLFRIASSSEQHLAATSRWASSQFYMAHFAISKKGDKKMTSHERLARAAVGIAGSDDSPAMVWLENWQLAQRADDAKSWTIRASQDNDQLDLILVAQKPVVLHGDQGLSRKGPSACNSSYYYSITRLQTNGEIIYHGQRYEVSGSAWLDREWSTSALDAGLTGWDWFALQLIDGRDLMYYRLRRTDGSTDPYSYAVLIDREGQRKRIDVSEVEHTVTQWWQSDKGARYPIWGRLSIPSEGIMLAYQPLIENQELDLTVRYWEGAIELVDTAGQVLGAGYLELTGY